MKTIGMYEFAVNEPDDMESTGCGPCIGVAFVAPGGGALMHSNDPRMVTGEDFLASVDSSIPTAEREGISPVVFGGAPDEDQATTYETEAAHRWLCDELIALGFRKPTLFPCPTLDSSQDVFVSSSDKKVIISTRVGGFRVAPFVVDLRAKNDNEQKRRYEEPGVRSGGTPDVTASQYGRSRQQGADWSLVWALEYRIGSYHPLAGDFDRAEQILAKHGF
jgi:hypothetical protein